MKLTTSRSGLKIFLISIGTDMSPHTKGSLINHLMGTFDLLKLWGCEESICIAGGLHSIYGTNIYKLKSVSIKKRELVRQRFGEDAERFAWLFGSLDRPLAIEEGFGFDRRQNAECFINTRDLQPLRLIEAANLLEQGESLKQWPNIRRIAKKQMRLYL